MKRELLLIGFALALLSVKPIAAGEAGGAYGGDTTPPPPEPFEQVDENRDGQVDQEEARSAGIEMFDEADRDRNGSLDRSEFSALEEDGTLRKRCKPGR